MEDKPKYKFKDIETDNKKFFFTKEFFQEKGKGIFRNRDNPKLADDEVFECEILWRSRIGLSSSKVQKNSATKDGSVLHRRISSYFRLITDFINYETYCLVAHGKRLSVFDLTNDTENMLVEQYSLSDTIKFVTIIEDEASETKVVVILENNEYYTMKLVKTELIIEQQQPFTEFND